MSFELKITLIFLVWVLVFFGTFLATRHKSNWFSSFRSRVVIAGLFFIVSSLTCSGVINYFLLEYYKGLVRASEFDKSFVEEFAYMSAQNLANYYTLFSTMFGASIGSALLYKGLYPRH